jgi:hypothetical protein
LINTCAPYLSLPGNTLGKANNHSQYPKIKVKAKGVVFTGIHIPGKVQSGGCLTNRSSGQYSRKIRLLELSNIISVIG